MRSSILRQHKFKRSSQMRIIQENEFTPQPSMKSVLQKYQDITIYAPREFSSKSLSSVNFAYPSFSETNKSIHDIIHCRHCLSLSQCFILSGITVPALEGLIATTLPSFLNTSIILSSILLGRTVRKSLIRPGDLFHGLGEDSFTSSVKR
jgi:hypothetical protein